jgi:hypothetical protein
VHGIHSPIASQRARSPSACARRSKTWSVLGAAAILKSRASWHCEVAIDGLGEAISITVYRLIQECLTNVLRHCSSPPVSPSRCGAMTMFYESAFSDNGIRTAGSRRD